MKFDTVDECLCALDHWCRTTSPVASSEDAERRMKRGQRQSLCTACNRWKWKDQRCNHFVDGGADSGGGKHDR